MPIVFGIYVVCMVVASLMSDVETSSGYAHSIGFFIAYALMSVLIHLTAISWIGRFLRLIGAVVLVVVLEIAQNFFPGGDPSLLDVVVNISGIIIGAVLCGFYTRTVSHRAVRLLASELEAELKKCHVSSRCGDERLESRFNFRGYRIRVGAGRLVCIMLTGFEGSVCFALGAPNDNYLMNDQIDSPPTLHGLPLFIHAGYEGPSTEDWLKREVNLRSLADLEPSRREPLFVFHGGIEIAVRPIRATLETLSKLADIAVLLEESAPEAGSDLVIDGLRLNPDLLPEPLRELVPLIKMWAVGDDVKRRELLETASAEELEQLKDRVCPLMDRIDEYLDSFPMDKVPEEAALVGRLAEAVAELGG
jgi:VanZ family protein